MPAGLRFVWIMSASLIAMIVEIKPAGLSLVGIPAENQPSRKFWITAPLSMGKMYKQMGHRSRCAFQSLESVDRTRLAPYQPPLIRGWRHLRTLNYYRLEPHREADISTQPTRACAPSRLPHPHGDQEWPKDCRASSRQGPQASDGLAWPSLSKGQAVS
jgi:hypothetical protein